MTQNLATFLILILSFGLAGLAPVLARRRGAILLWLFPAVSAGYWLSRMTELGHGQARIESFRWIERIPVEIAFQLDGLGLLLATLISGMGAIVVIYSLAYFGRDDGRIGRFIGLLLFFKASMLGLVLADDLILFFVFWELTTISSFFLIGFNSRDDEARRSALQALLVTAGGGLALLAGLILLIQQTGSARFSEIVQLKELAGGEAVGSAALVLILIGALTKSAQFPFHFWLPAAMRAPTPVSAYLHSATMVKAGIYLLARLSPALAAHPLWTAILPAAGALTFGLGAVLAIRQRDLKLVMAYMTVAALGLMTLLLGLGTAVAITAAMAYLVVHSLYKGAGFLVVGIIDHQTGTRDLSVLGKLAKGLRYTTVAACLAALSMAGIPLFFGFVGKELVYEALLAANPFGALLPVLGVFGFAAMTAAAAMLGLRPFFAPTAMQVPRHDAPVGMWIGPLLLGVLGFALGVHPALMDFWLGFAAGSVIGVPREIELAIWHGWNVALGMSVGSFLLGMVLFRYWMPAGRALEGPGRVFAYLDPRRGYELGLDALVRFAAAITRTLQNGSLRRYLIILFALIAGLVAALLPLPTVPGGWGDVIFYEWAAVGLMVAAALIVLSVASPLGAVIFLGVVGYSIAMIYVFFGAPDLAMTQFLVETLTVILMALALVHLPARKTPKVSTVGQFINGAVALAVGVSVTALVWSVLQYPLDQDLNRFFSEHSLTLAHGRNVVNVILVDFRAIDTLGELTVLGIGGLGVHALLKLKRGRRAPQ